MDSGRIIKGNNANSIVALLLCLGFGIWLGVRPPTEAFADTGTYASTFSHYQKGAMPYNSADWIFAWFSYYCAQTISVSSYFTILSLGYFGFILLACKKLFRNNVLVAYLFMLGAFTFFTYCVNGVRNGLACSILLFAMALVAHSRKNLLFAIALCFITAGIHSSTLLPSLCLFVSLFVVKNFKWAYTFWIASIFISLVAGGFVTSFFAGLGFDDRLSYLQKEMSSDTFNRTGFRWDFLIYSMMPIILGYYVVIKRGIRNRTYEILLNTYTLSNAFWVMVIRANYSNRFAYLSWFMYPLVLAYPLLNMNVWEQSQGKIASRIMLAHVGFTWFMLTFYN